MKKILAAFISLVLCHALYAANEAQLKVKITNSLKENKYFLCVYNVGCLSIRNGDLGKTFVMPTMDVGNITKFVITDVTNMRIYMQPAPDSCHVVIKDNQKLTISGHLHINHAVPSISDLQCAVTS